MRPRHTQNRYRSSHNNPGDCVSSRLCRVDLVITALRYSQAFSAVIAVAQSVYQLSAAVGAIHFLYLASLCEVADACLLPHAGEHQGFPVVLPGRR